MLSLTTKKSISLFDMVFYTQGDDVAMRSPLGSSLANAFLCHHETKWLNDCPEKFKSAFYKKYVDDIFVLLKRPGHVKPFVDYMETKHKSINFSFGKEKDSPTCSPEKYYDYRNSWNLIKITIFVIFSITSDQVLPITATRLAVSSQNRYNKTPHRTLDTKRRRRREGLGFFQFI